MKSPDDEIIGSFLESNVYAVIGVSPDMSKYGYKVYEDLKNGGYTVYAVNPGYDSIYGEKCYPDLKSLPEKPDVVEFVCPPKVTEKVVRTLPELGIHKAWMQPGTESVQAIYFCRQNDIEVLHDVCIMVQRRKAAPDG
ncbi:MAG: CoA-binding protein [Actinobacteria bacterium]|nr:CoA-binding protein [Actinomycetota bacterium]MCG2818009.1 CoA-binding protein [Actinomycetes bacterium]MBU4217675.1 CoA-binding protein [Actinomycetota bacterium]MBU4359376.1 CoA-binding protein [Actinomycetota bacterium]MBU4391864.1 CoA-binding protein [Actinomycetota bacterium]